ncbi:MAG: DNA-invertase hin, partial [Pseudomonadota bacterium]
LFHLLKNPVYRGKIVHKGKVYDGEHEAIVDEGLWNAVQAQLKEKAPPRRRSTNEPQQAMLRGLITDPHGRPMVPTYGSSKVKRYAYYETRKDLARPGDPTGIRFQRGHLEQHLISHLGQLLDDEHALRRLSGIEEAGTLRTMFANAHLLALQLREIGKVEGALRFILAAIAIRADGMDIILKPDAFGIEPAGSWYWTMPLPARKPFREARLRIDADAGTGSVSNDLLALVAEAMAAQRLVLASPELSLAQLAKREGRCRTQIARLLRLSWLSPRIIDAIANGTQPKGLTRRALLVCDMPIDWAEQERQFGFAA